MKKLLWILILSLLSVSIDLSNPTTVKAATFEELMISKKERIIYLHILHKKLFLLEI
jgi:hypothetical protein